MDAQNVNFAPRIPQNGVSQTQMLRFWTNFPTRRFYRQPNTSSLTQC